MAAAVPNAAVKDPGARVDEIVKKLAGDLPKGTAVYREVFNQDALFSSDTPTKYKDSKTSTYAIVPSETSEGVDAFLTATSSVYREYSFENRAILSKRFDDYVQKDSFVKVIDDKFPTIFNKSPIFQKGFKDASDEMKLFKICWYFGLNCIILPFKWSLYQTPNCSAVSFAKTETGKFLLITNENYNGIFNWTDKAWCFLKGSVNSTLDEIHADKDIAPIKELYTAWTYPEDCPSLVNNNWNAARNLAGAKASAPNNGAAAAVVAPAPGPNTTALPAPTLNNSKKDVRGIIGTIRANLNTREGNVTTLKAQLNQAEANLEKGNVNKNTLAKLTEDLVALAGNVEKLPLRTVGNGAPSAAVAGNSGAAAAATPGPSASAAAAAEEIAVPLLPANFSKDVIRGIKRYQDEKFLKEFAKIQKTQYNDDVAHKNEYQKDEIPHKITTYEKLLRTLKTAKDKLPMNASNSVKLLISQIISDFETYKKWYEQLDKNLAAPAALAAAGNTNASPNGSAPAAAALAAAPLSGRSAAAALAAAGNTNASPNGSAPAPAATAALTAAPPRTFNSYRKNLAAEIQQLKTIAKGATETNRFTPVVINKQIANLEKRLNSAPNDYSDLDKIQISIRSLKESIPIWIESGKRAEAAGRAAAQRKTRRGGKRRQARRVTRKNRRRNSRKSRA